MYKSTAENNPKLINYFTLSNFLKSGQLLQEIIQPLVKMKLYAV